MIKPSRRLLLTGAAAALAAPAVARADAWPSRPIRCIVPLPPGGGTDYDRAAAPCSISRRRSGVPIVVDNKPGAGGTIGSDVVAKAEPDGYTIGIATASSHAAAPVFRKDLPYDPVKSFTAITMLGTTPYILIGGPAAGATRSASLHRRRQGQARQGRLRLARRLDAGLSADQAVRTDRRHRDGRRALQGLGAGLSRPDERHRRGDARQPSGSAGLVREGRPDGLRRAPGRRPCCPTCRPSRASA